MKDVKEMLRTIVQFDKEHGKYKKHMKKKKAKPITKVEQAWRKDTTRVDAYREHVTAIERHVARERSRSAVEVLSVSISV
ncbi:MAG: hypothetical protein O7G85_08175 [Planctomycetota bacterium]|nr:hypothetical protein [Planctomycetota bacterium]